MPGRGKRRARGGKITFSSAHSEPGGDHGVCAISPASNWCLPLADHLTSTTIPATKAVSGSGQLRSRDRGETR